MSRRKDRERFLAQRALNPDYPGFRGYDREPDRPGQTPMQAVTCSVCGRKRNVPVGVAQAAGDKFVCDGCQEKAVSHAPPPEEKPGQSAT